MWRHVVSLASVLQAPSYVVLIGLSIFQYLQFKIEYTLCRSIFHLTRGFKFKVQHPVLGYWRLLKKLHRVS